MLLMPVLLYSQYEKYNIKICPLSLVDEFSFPLVQGGFETKLSQRLSLYNEIGVKYRKGYYEEADTSFINASGIKAKTELRYYLPKSFGVEEIRTMLNGLYVGVNLFYIKDKHNSEIKYYANRDSSFVSLDNISVVKNVIGLNLIAGIQKKLANKFLIDIYAGIGYRIRIISNQHREFDKDRDSLDKPTDITPRGIRNTIDLKEGISNSLSLTLGIRLGYRF
jgi:hypothetical protein